MKYAYDFISHEIYYKKLGFLYDNKITDYSTETTFF